MVFVLMPKGNIQKLSGPRVQNENSLSEPYLGISNSFEPESKLIARLLRAFER